MNARYGAQWELYDLAADSGEFENLTIRPESREPMDWMHGKLVEELGRDPDESESLCRQDQRVGYGRTLNRVFLPALGQ
jgi:hypothetical protein